MSRILRRTALATTLVLGIANLPVAFTATEEDVPGWLQWPATVLGVLGVAAFVSLVKRLPGSVPFVMSVGLVNVLAGVLALADGHPSAIVGLVLGGVAAVTSTSLIRRPDNQLANARS